MAETDETASRPRRRRLLWIGAGLVVVLVAVAGVVLGVRWYTDAHRTDLERAMAGAPSASRYSWTDWAGVRAELGSDVDSDSDRAELEKFLDAGFDADLTSTSALVQSAPDLQRLWGFSPADVDWELFSQSTAGALVQLHVPDDYDFDALADRLGTIGYESPGSGQELDGGVWSGGQNLLSRTADVTPELAFISLDADAHLITASDQSSSLDPGLGSLGDDLVGTSVDEVNDEGVGDVVHALGASGGGVDGGQDPLTASIYTGDFACRTLAMSQADDADQSQADQLLAAAGTVNPLSGFGIAEYAGGQGRVEMSFETDDQAQRNADPRAALVSGPAPGQGGSFTDRFDLGDVTADGRVVTIDADPTQGSYFVSDLSNGPVLFATC